MHDKLLPSKIHFEKLFGFCPLRRGSRYVLDEVISGPEFGGSHSFLILLSAFFSGEILIAIAKKTKKKETLEQKFCHVINTLFSQHLLFVIKRRWIFKMHGQFNSMQIWLWKKGTERKSWKNVSSLWIFVLAHFRNFEFWILQQTSTVTNFAHNNPSRVFYQHFESFKQQKLSRSASKLKRLFFRIPLKSGVATKVSTKVRISRE